MTTQEIERVHCLGCGLVTSITNRPADRRNLRGMQSLTFASTWKDCVINSGILDAEGVGVNQIPSLIKSGVAAVVRSQAVRSASFHPTEHSTSERAKPCARPVHSYSSPQKTQTGEYWTRTADAALAKA